MKLNSTISNSQKKWLEKIREMQIKPVYLACFSAALFLFTLIPILLLAKYSYPCVDDFGYGLNAHIFWKTTGSLQQTFQWAMKQVHSSYDTWQGTFSSIFLMALQPAVFSEDAYWITPFIMLGMLIGSHLFIWKVFLRDLLKADKPTYWIIATISLLVMIQQFFWPAQGIYWFNGSVHYTFMHSCMLFLVGSVILILLSVNKAKKVRLTLLSCFLAVISGGSNFATSLITCVILLLVLAIGLLKVRKAGVLLLFPTVVHFICFYFNVSAPGNAIRQAYFTRQKPVGAIFDSFIEAIRRGDEWYTMLLFLCMLLVIPAIWNLVGKTEFTFPYPGIVTLFSLCIVAAMHTPIYYSQGSDAYMLDRVVNIIKLMYHFFLFGNQIYWMGYLHRYLKKKGISFQILHRMIFYVAIALLVIVSFYTTSNRERDFISYAAYSTLRSGLAEGYRQEYLTRRELLNSEEQNVVLPGYTYRSFLLFVDDITTDKEDWRNIQMKNWYGKESVVLASPFP